MIELRRITPLDSLAGEEFWSDETNEHVIARETEETVRYDGDGPGWYVRDEVREMGPFDDFAQALAEAEGVWREVTLAPANRLRDAIEVEDENDVGTYLLEYLATYGAVGIDAQALARRVFERIEGA